MTRRSWFLLTGALAGCGSKPERSIDPLPETVAGVWRRKEWHDMPLSEAPDPVPQSSLRRFESALYHGPGVIQARAYQLTSKAVGLELAQRWRPSADTVFFWAGDWFIVLKWQDADRTALQAFTREVEARLNTAPAR